MGYLCPVCDEPFGSDTACINHLAVTAMLHGETHEQWLIESAGDWETVPRAELADIVAEQAVETTDHDHPGDHTHPADKGSERASRPQPAVTESTSETMQLDSDAQRILSEARELTRHMQERGPTNDAQESPTSEDERKES